MGPSEACRGRLPLDQRRRQRLHHRCQPPLKLATLRLQPAGRPALARTPKTQYRRTPATCRPLPAAPHQPVAAPQLQHRSELQRPTSRPLERPAHAGHTRAAGRHCCCARGWRAPPPTPSHRPVRPARWIPEAPADARDWACPQGLPKNYGLQQSYQRQQQQGGARLRCGFVLTTSCAPGRHCRCAMLHPACQRRTQHPWRRSKAAAPRGAGTLGRWLHVSRPSCPAGRPPSDVTRNLPRPCGTIERRTYPAWHRGRSARLSVQPDPCPL